MAYYDQFTKKPENKRDDWRDDALTHRPARDAQILRGAGKGGYADGKPGKKRYEEGRGDKPRGDRRQENGRYEERRGDKPRVDRRQENGRYDERRGDRPRVDRRQENGRYDERRGDKPRGDRRQENGRYDERRGDKPRGDRRHEERPPRNAPPEEAENLLVGRNPIREALRAGRDIEKLLVARGELMGSAREIVAMARERRVVVQEVDRAKLDAMAPGHQGMIAVASAYAYATVEDMLALARSRGEEPFLVLLDGVTDPHNLGAIIRSAECAGAHGVIIPERRAVGLTPAAVKASAGAVEHIPVAREVNLTRVIERLKREGIWIYGAAMEGEDYRKTDLSGPAALVVGSEGEGISRLVAGHCDRLVGLPMKGKIGSLNASVAAGVLLYAVMSARDGR